MLSRRLPLQQRLLRAFGLFSGSLLLLTWLAGLSYLLVQERAELIESLRTHAAIIATQSSAAVLFEDPDAMAENISSLRYVEDLVWVAILQPPKSGSQERRLLAAYGRVPDDLSRYVIAFADGGNVYAELTRITIRQEIELNGSYRADLLLQIDMRPTMLEFAKIIVTSLALNLAVLTLAIVFFRHIVGTVTRPLEDLLQLVERVEREGIPSERATVLHDDEIGRLGISFNRMLDGLSARENALAESRDNLRALSHRLQAVREEERTRISHEIHDELGQRMTALKFAVARLKDGEGREQLGAMIDSTIKVVRSIAWELRPGLLDTVGLEAAIEWLAQDFRQRIGIRCGVDLPSVPVVVLPEQATDIFRVCQELLTNIARHAKASRADIRLWCEGDSVLLCVSDNGIGMYSRSDATASLGLLGIHERVRRWGGQVVTSQTSADGGTTVRIEMPLVAPTGRNQE